MEEEIKNEETEESEASAKELTSVEEQPSEETGESSEEEIKETPEPEGSQ